MDHQLGPTSGSWTSLSTQLARAVLAALAAVILTACGGGQNDASGEPATVALTDDAATDGAAQVVSDARVDTSAVPSGAASGGPAGYTRCAAENGTCSFSGTQSVVYGANNRFYARSATGGSACNNATFGDPISGTRKSCYVRACTPTAVTPYLMVSGGAWQNVSSVTAPSGSSITLGPQPLNGAWRWWGSDGLTATSREITRTITTDITYTANHTNPSGCVNHQIFTLTASSSSTPSSGTAMPVGDLPGWQQIFTDDFTTPVALGAFPDSTYSTRWFPYNAGSGDTSGYGTYNSGKVASVSGGILDQWLHTENGVHYVNALVAKMPPNGWGQLYGRYSIRLRSDVMPGYKIVPLLWPDSDIWADGEIDFPEVNTLTAEDKAKANLFGADNTGWQQRVSNISPTSGWHVYTIDWKPNSLTYYIDGVQLGATMTVGVPYKPMHWVLQLESAIGMGAPAASVNGHVQIDWAVAYRYAP